MRKRLHTNPPGARRVLAPEFLKGVPPEGTLPKTYKTTIETPLPRYRLRHGMQLDCTAYLYKSLGKLGLVGYCNTTHKHYCAKSPWLGLTSRTPSA